MIASLITKRACRTRRQTTKSKTRQTAKQNRTTINADVLNESLRPVIRQTVPSYQTRRRNQVHGKGEKGRGGGLNVVNYLPNKQTRQIMPNVWLESFATVVHKSLVEIWAGRELSANQGTIEYCWRLIMHEERV